MVEKPKGIQIGILDDIAPDGSSNTACQKIFEDSALKGHVVEVKTEISPGIFKANYYIISSDDKP